jgi:malate dehydrogenase
LEARGSSSGASAANAAVDHVRDWVLGADGLRSMAVATNGSYGIPEGLIASLPVRVTGDGSLQIVEGLEVPAFSQERIDRTIAELQEERAAVVSLGLVA